MRGMNAFELTDFLMSQKGSIELLSFLSGRVLRPYKSLSFKQNMYSILLRVSNVLLSYFLYEES